jgi:hypothetical protein
MKIQIPLITVTKVISNHRHCSICSDDTKARWEIGFKSGYNSQNLIAYCDKHKQQLVDEIKSIDV